MKFKIASLSIILLLLSASSSYAYIDPGIGSFMLQMLVAMIAGVSLFFINIKKKIKIILIRIRSFFFKKN